MHDMSDPLLIKAEEQDTKLREVLSTMSNATSIKDFDAKAFQCAHHFFNMLDCLRRYYKQEHTLDIVKDDTDYEVKHL